VKRNVLDLEILDQDELAVDDARIDAHMDAHFDPMDAHIEKTLGQATRKPALAPEPATWVCPPHWLAPKMHAEGPTIWLDPEPLRLVGPVTIWLSARSENGGGTRY
jgi:hypothetical protein